MKNLTISLFFLFLFLIGCSKKEETVEPSSKSTISATITPNPTTGVITITFDQVYTEVTIELVAINGIIVETLVVKNTQIAILSIDGNNGLYIINITNSLGATKTYQVVKQ